MAQNPESVCYTARGRSGRHVTPAGFLSKKFSAAQQNYHTHEHETIAILEVLIKWEDKLLGRKFVIVTHHKSLKYFKTQLSLSSQQTCWWEYLSCFNFTVQHVDGTSDWVVDCLSRYYKLDGPEDHHPDHEFVSADAWFDLDRELLPVQWYVELCAAAARQPHHLAEKLKQCVLESNQMNKWPAESPMGPAVSPHQPSDDIPLAVELGADGESLHTHIEKYIDLACIV